MRYWLYKCNNDGGPAGRWGDWRTMVFHKASPSAWGGHHGTQSPRSAAHIEHDVAVGDVVVAYQTDEQSVIGFCVITRINGSPGEKELYVKPIERLATPWKMHKHKAGTSLEKSWSVRGPVMLSELTKENMDDIIKLTGTPRRVLQGKPKAGGYQP